MAFGDVCFRGNSGHWGMSALPPKADIGTQQRDVCFVPRADIAPDQFDAPLLQVLTNFRQQLARNKRFRQPIVNLVY
jgi:hypothetical protein